MIKGKDILGKNIVAINSGQKVDTVRDVVFDHQGNQVLGLLVDEGGWFRAAKVVPFERIRSFGEDAIMIGDAGDLTTSREDGRLADVLENKINLIGMTLLTTDGQNLGKIADVFFDEHTGRVEGYEATGGLFADLSSGRAFIPAPQSVQIGADAAIVPISVAAAMQERGGVKGALHAATENVTGGVQRAADTVQDHYETARSTLREGVENVTQAAQDRQQALLVGRQAGADLVAPDGTVIVRAGETITPLHAEVAEWHGLLGALTANATGGAVTGAANAAGQRIVEVYTTARDRVQDATHSLRTHLSDPAPTADADDVLGRRVRRDLRAGPTLIAAAGQIVTPDLLRRAQTAGLSAELAAATQDQPGASSVTEGAGNLLNRARQWLNERREETESAIQERQDALHDRQIREALGRPVTRVILAPDDTVILNVGEVITHRAVQAAQQAGVLDILLGSVSQDPVNLDPLRSRPQETGQAALDSQPDLNRPD